MCPHASAAASLSSCTGTAFADARRPGFPSAVALAATLAAAIAALEGIRRRHAVVLHILVVIVDGNQQRLWPSPVRPSPHAAKRKRQNHEQGQGAGHDGSGSTVLVEAAGAFRDTHRLEKRLMLEALEHQQEGAAN